MRTPAAPASANGLSGSGRPIRREVCGPTDSSVARMQWADDGGPCGPTSDWPATQQVPDPPAAYAGPAPQLTSRLDGEHERWREEVELVSLPFAEYSAVYPERLEWLQARLKSEPTGIVRFVIVDVTRVSRPGGLLLGALHAAAARMLKNGRCLVLAGDLCGLVDVSHLHDLCHVANSREAAFVWCRQHLNH